MKERMNDLILSGNNLDLTPGLRSYVTEKFEKLFSHEHHIIRIRVELEKEKGANPEKEYIAKGIIEIKGKDIVVSEQAAEIGKCVDSLVTKLDRQLRRRSRLRKVKRKRTNVVEIPAEIPKTRKIA